MRTRAQNVDAAQLTDVRCIDGLELLSDAQDNQMWLANDRFGQTAPQRGLL
jgi:hypothetical protein